MRTSEKKPNKNFFESISEPFWLIIESVPVGLPACLAAFGGLVTLLLVAGWLQSFLVALLGVPLILLVFFAVTRVARTDRPGSIKEQRIFGLIIIVGVLVWGIANIKYTAQNIFVYRDPAAYTVTSAWLIDHPDLDIRSPEFLQDNPHVAGSSAGFGGFEYDSGDRDRISPHGVHLLPALSGLVGRMSNEGIALRTNLIIGMIALLSIYGFGRLIVKPRWAFTAAAAVAVSLPFLYFSRDMYTEPLAIAFAFGGLSLAWYAMKTRAKSAWLLSGLTIGAGLLARIDALLIVAAIIFALLLRIAFSAKKQRHKTDHETLWFSIGALGIILIAWFDLTRLSPAYYEVHKSHIMQEFALIALSGAMGIVVVLLNLKTDYIRRLGAATKNKRGYVIFSLTIAAFLFLALRPIWYPSVDARYNITQIGGHEAILRDHESGGVVYNTEAITQWIVWYMGPVLALTGLLGAALLAKKASYEKNALLLPVLFVVLGISIVFMIKPRVTPDQIWAVRRLLPVTIPGAALFSMVTLQYVEKALAKKTVVKTIVLTVLVTTAFAGVVSASSPFLETRTYSKQIEQIRAVCQVLPQNAVVFWGGTMGYEAVQTTRSYCDVEAMRILDLDKESIASIARDTVEAGHTPIVGFIAPQNQLVVGGENMNFINNTEHEDIEMVLAKLPRKTVKSSRSILLGSMGLDGKVYPLTHNP